MNEKLTEYIRKRIELKHDINEIKYALVHAGHDIAVVEEHINHVLHTKKSKKFPFVAVFALIAILIFGYVFYANPDLTKKTKIIGSRQSAYNKSEDSTSGSVSSCDEECMDKKFLNEALIKNDVSICSRISSSVLKNQCESLFGGI